MYPFLHPAPVRRLTRTESLPITLKTNAVFFDIDLVSAPPHSQVYLGYWACNQGVLVQIDALTGYVLNPQHHGEMLGILDEPLVHRTPIRLALEMERFGRLCITRLVVNGESLVLPAFQISRPCKLHAVSGYVATDFDEVPLFGRHEILHWDHDIDRLASQGEALIA